MNKAFQLILISVIAALLLFSSCGSDDDPAPVTITTTVTTNFSSQGGGGAFDYVEGGDVEDITLSASALYTIDLQIQQDSGSVMIDFDQRIRDNAELYQIFYQVLPTSAPTVTANFFYTDADGDGLPIGLTATFVTLGSGDKTFVITVKQMDAGTKTNTDIADPDSSPGETIIEATYNFSVQ